MRITITARHCDVADELRTRARALLARLERIAPRPQDARILFVADNGRPLVEVRLHAARGVLHVAKARAGDHRSALDAAVAKVRRQLDKSPIRRRAGHGRRARTPELR
ncbi:MAG TPA: HPF/RaiA family ribosome-associated protein [Gemmatimonadales bacterium]|nr:HPF/RaiA family ribosome-associated protein [Gemmatimonadales bacterium]